MGNTFLFSTCDEDIIKAYISSLLGTYYVIKRLRLNVTKSVERCEVRFNSLSVIKYVE